MGCQGATSTRSASPAPEQDARREPQARAPKPQREAPAPEAPIEPLPASWRRGVALGLFSSAKDPAEQRAHYTLLLDEIAAVGATDLSLVVRWSQADIYAAAIAADPKVTTPDDQLIWVIEQAKARGLAVFLMPILNLERRDAGQWRGRLAPKDPDAWWRAYERYILHYAKLSQRTGVKTLAVGSELLSMERERERWLALIKKTRAAFKGELTYSANWDHFEVVSFWDAIDIVGMTGYQELSDATAPTLAQLQAGWGPFRQRLALWSQEHERRYMFTEVGYPSNERGCAKPWDYTSAAPPAPKLQARCYRAFFELWRQDKWLEGVYIWNWFGPRSPDDRGYSPRGKPSEALIKRYFAPPKPSTEDKDEGA